MRKGCFFIAMFYSALLLVANANFFYLLIEEKKMKGEKSKKSQPRVNLLNCFVFILFSFDCFVIISFTTRVSDLARMKLRKCAEKKVVIGEK